MPYLLPFLVLPFLVLPLDMFMFRILALDAPPALPFRILALDMLMFAFEVVVVVVAPPVVAVLFDVVVVVVVEVVFALPFVFSVVQPLQKAATASRAKRAKVFRIEFSPVTQAGRWL
jgi:hypothetical protein